MAPDLSGPSRTETSIGVQGNPVVEDLQPRLLAPPGRWGRNLDARRSYHRGMESLEFLPAVTPSRWKGVVSAILAVLIAASGIVGAGVTLLPRHLEYRIGHGELAVVTGTVVLPRIRRWPLGAVEKLRNVQLRGGKRLFGTAMPGYCAGLFRASGRTYRLYATRSKGPFVILEGSSWHLGLTPADPEAFLDALRNFGVPVEET